MFLQQNGVTVANLLKFFMLASVVPLAWFCRHKTRTMHCTITGKRVVTCMVTLLAIVVFLIL